MSVKAKIFTNGRNQAVRIPKAMAFKGVDAVAIEQQGNSLVLTPIRKTWESMSELDKGDADFLRLRPRMVNKGRSGDVS